MGQPGTGGVQYRQGELVEEGPDVLGADRPPGAPNATLRWFPNVASWEIHEGIWGFNRKITHSKYQLVGLREKLQETPIFHGKIYEFL